MTAATSHEHASLPGHLRRPGRLLREMRSRREPPPLSVETVRAVLVRFGIEAVGPLTVLPMGWRSDNVVVSTTTGAVVVKRYPVRAVLETIVHEHSIARRLETGGLPVASLRTSEGGATWCMSEDRYFSVADLVEGVSLSGCLLRPSRDQQLHRDAGVLLARFHTELEGFHPEGRHHLGVEAEASNSSGLDGLLASLEELREVAVAGPSLSTERWLAERSGAMADSIRDLDRRLADRALGVGIIHGDYGLHNLTYARDGRATVHDLELARRDLLLIDVVVVLSRSSVRCGRAFLDGYRSVRSIRSEEWRAIPELWEHYRLSGAVRSWQNFRDQGGERRLTAARRRVEEAGRVAAHGVRAWE